MLRTKFCIIKVYNDYYALRSTKIIDILGSFNEATIEKFSTKGNALFFYKAQPIHLIYSPGIFKNIDNNSTKMYSILVICERFNGEKRIFGLPVHEITGYEYFEDKTLMPLKSIPDRNVYSYSFEHKKKRIYMLDIYHMLRFHNSFDPEVQETIFPEISYN